MLFPIILAHGQLGRYDEVIFLSLAALFISIIGLAWVKSRNTIPEFDDADVADTAPDSDSNERFQLD
ncbi:MAG: hypothetical protein CUN54_07260 [Phototrophicales bacterium]|nr:MAG: hypothetical protein CUN54_07260 [Phototrophicales bacterium]